MEYKNLTLKMENVTDEEFIAVIVSINKTIEEYTDNNKISSDNDFWTNHISLLVSAKSKLQKAYRKELE